MILEESEDRDVINSRGKHEEDQQVSWRGDTGPWLTEEYSEIRGVEPTKFFRGGKNHLKNDWERPPECPRILIILTRAGCPAGSETVWTRGYS